MFTVQRLVGLMVCGFPGWAGPVGADAVTDWNEIAMQTVSAGRSGPAGMLDVALVHIAIHDAVQAIDKRFEPYHVEIEGAKGSRSAAAAAAAHGVLVNYPEVVSAADLDAKYFAWLADKKLAFNHFLLPLDDDDHDHHGRPDDHGHGAGDHGDRK